jgi:hypothetical protein
MAVKGGDLFYDLYGQGSDALFDRQRETLATAANYEEQTVT